MPDAARTAARPVTITCLVSTAGARWCEWAASAYCEDACKARAYRRRRLGTGGRCPCCQEPITQEEVITGREN